MTEQLLLTLALLCALASAGILFFFYQKERRAVVSAAASNLLDYASLIDEHVIALKSGALMQIYELCPCDLSGESDERLDYVRTMVNRALMKLGDGFAVHVDALREASTDYRPVSHEEDGPVYLFDREKARSLRLNPQSYSTRFYLTLTRLGDKKAVRALTGIMTEGPGSAPEKSDALKATRALIDSFKDACQNVTDTLSLTLRLRPLGFVTDREGRCLHEAVSFIHRAYTGINAPLVLPAVPAYLDAIIATQDLTPAFTVKVGERYHSVIAIEGLPSASKFLILGQLASLPCEYRFSTRFIVFDDLKTAFLMERYRRFWKQRERGFVAQIFNLGHGRLNQNAVEKVAEIDDEKARLDDRSLLFGSYCANVILSSECFEELEELSRELVRRIEDLGFGARIESVNATEAFLGSLPGHLTENVRCPMVSQEILADLLPLSAPWQGEAVAPHAGLGPGASPLMQCRLAHGKGVFYLNLHEGDLGNTIVAGPPGSGKSVFLGALILNYLRYLGSRVFVFEKGWSFYALTRAAMGEHVRFDNARASFCPLRELNTPLSLDYAMEYVELISRLSGHEVTVEERLEIARALKLLASRPADAHSLSDLHLLLSSQTLRQAVEAYTVKVNPGSLLDGLDNPSFKQRLTVFECSTLFEQSRRFLLPVLKQVFHLIESALNGKPVLIVIDEAWMMLEEPVFARELLKWFKTLRKHNVAVVMATQSLTDIATSGLFEPFLDCAKTRIFLPNYDAGGEVLSPVYREMGLNSRHISTITTAEPKRQYFMKKGTHSALFELILTEGERALLSLAGDHVVPLIDERFTRFGPDLGFRLGGEAPLPRHLLPLSRAPYPTQNECGVSEHAGRAA